MLKLNDPDVLTPRNLDFITKLSAGFKRTLWPYHRAEVRGLERIPENHGAIYVGNHNGYPYMSEVFIFLSGLFEKFGISRYPYILAHDFSLKLPLVNQFLTNYGCIRASRGNAERVLDLGESLLVYPGGSDELMRPYRDRTRLKFQARTGYVRLALKYGRPIVPVVAVGGHSTAVILDDLCWLAEAIGAKRRLRIGAWPLILSVPWGLTLGPVIPPYLPWPSKIIVEVLDPLVFPSATSVGANEETWPQECALRVERTIEAAMKRLEAERVSRHLAAPKTSQPLPRRSTRSSVTRAVPTVAGAF